MNPKFRPGQKVSYLLAPHRSMIVIKNKTTTKIVDGNLNTRTFYTGFVTCSWPDKDGNRLQNDFLEEELQLIDEDMPFSTFETDIISILKKSTGETLENLRASVATGKISMTGSQILIEPGDLINRKMSNGGEEVYQVIDPGFHESFHGISAGYNMKVRKLGLPEARRERQSIVYHINIGGNNNRFNNNSIDQSTNKVESSNPIDDHIIALRKEIDQLKASVEDKVEALELVEELQAQFHTGNPKRSLVKSIISSLSEHGANIASIGSLILQLLPPN